MVHWKFNKHDLKWNKRLLRLGRESSCTRLKKIFAHSDPSLKGSHIHLKWNTAIRREKQQEQRKIVRRRKKPGRKKQMFSEMERALPCDSVELGETVWHIEDSKALRGLFCPRPGVQYSATHAHLLLGELVFESSDLCTCSCHSPLRTFAVCTSIYFGGLQLQ